MQKEALECMCGFINLTLFVHAKNFLYAGNRNFWKLCFYPELYYLNALVWILGNTQTDQMQTQKYCNVNESV